MPDATPNICCGLWRASTHRPLVVLFCYCSPNMMSWIVCISYIQLWYCCKTNISKPRYKVSFECVVLKLLQDLATIVPAKLVEGLTKASLLTGRIFFIWKSFFFLIYILIQHCKCKKKRENWSGGSQPITQFLSCFEQSEQCKDKLAVRRRYSNICN